MGKFDEIMIKLTKDETTLDYYILFGDNNKIDENRKGKRVLLSHSGMSRIGESYIYNEALKLQGNVHYKGYFNGELCDGVEGYFVKEVIRLQKIKPSKYFID